EEWDDEPLELGRACGERRKSREEEPGEQLVQSEDDDSGGQEKARSGVDNARDIQRERKRGGVEDGERGQLCGRERAAKPECRDERERERSDERNEVERKLDVLRVTDNQEKER